MVNFDKSKSSVAISLRSLKSTTGALYFANWIAEMLPGVVS